MKVSNGKRALFDLLYQYDEKNYEILTEKEYKGQRIYKPVIIKFDKNYKNKNINIRLYS